VFWESIAVGHSLYYYYVLLLLSMIHVLYRLHYQTGSTYYFSTTSALQLFMPVYALYHVSMEAGTYSHMSFDIPTITFFYMDTIHLPVCSKL